MQDNWIAKHEYSMLCVCMLTGQTMQWWVMCWSWPSPWGHRLRWMLTSGWTSPSGGTVSNWLWRKMMSGRRTRGPCLVWPDSTEQVSVEPDMYSQSDQTCTVTVTRRVQSPWPDVYSHRDQTCTVTVTRPVQSLWPDLYSHCDQKCTVTD